MHQTINREQFFQSMNELIPRDHPGAKRFEMFSIDLAIDQFYPITF